MSPFIRSTEQEPSVDGVKKKTVHYGLSKKKKTATQYAKLRKYTLPRLRFCF